jgi:hypothetical protein
MCQLSQKVLYILKVRNLISIPLSLSNPQGGLLQSNGIGPRENILYYGPEISTLYKGGRVQHEISRGPLQIVRTALSQKVIYSKTPTA